jgi:hypothetical protein
MNSLRLVNRAHLQQEEANTTFLDNPPTPSSTYVTPLPAPSPTPLGQLFPGQTYPSRPTYNSGYTPTYSSSGSTPTTYYSGGQDDSNDGGTVFLVIFFVVIVAGVLGLYVNFQSSGENEVLE